MEGNNVVEYNGKTYDISKVSNDTLLKLYEALLISQYKVESKIEKLEKEIEKLESKGE